MNWDISVGSGKQLVGRSLQWFGRHLDQRKWILRGEALQYRGRLQMRYGLLKHQLTWNTEAVRMREDPMAIKKSLSV